LHHNNYFLKRVPDAGCPKSELYEELNEVFGLGKSLQDGSVLGA